MAVFLRLDCSMCILVITFIFTVVVFSYPFVCRFIENGERVSLCPVPSNPRSGTLFVVGQLWGHVGLWNWVRNPLWYSGYYRFSSRLEPRIDCPRVPRLRGRVFGELEMEVRSASCRPRMWGLWQSWNRRDDWRGFLIWPSLAPESGHLGLAALCRSVMSWASVEPRILPLGPVLSTGLIPSLSEMMQTFLILPRL